MAGLLQPQLQTEIAIEQGPRAPDISSAFSGFFRTVQGMSNRGNGGPSVSELNLVADRTYGESLKKALALKSQGKPGQATALAKQATVDYVASGGNPNAAHTSIYEGVTGEAFSMIASTNEEEFSKVEWAGTDEAKMWMAKARNVNKTKFNDTLSDAQLVELAWSESQNNLAAQARKTQMETELDAGILKDSAGVAHEVIPLLQNDFAALMGFFDGATADGYASQEEIVQATTMVQEWIVQKYGKFMDHNEEVKRVVGEMNRLVESMGKMDFTGAAANRDFFHEVAKQIDDPLMRGYYKLLLGSPEGQKYLIEQSGGPEGALKFGETVQALRAPTQPKTGAPQGPAVMGQQNPHVTWGDYSMGTALDDRFSGLTDSTQPVPLTTPDLNAKAKKAIQATTSFVNYDLSKGIQTEPSLAKSFTTMAVLAAETVAAQTSSVLGKDLLGRFSDPRFIKNLSTLFSVDEAAGVKVATAYNSALSSELNRLNTAMGSYSSPRSVGLGMDETGAVQLDTTAFDEVVEASGDEQFKQNWEDIKVLIDNEGIEAYLKNDAHLGNRRTDIDSFANTNLRKVMELIDSARLVVDKQKRISHLIQKNKEAFLLYGDSKIIEQGIQADLDEQAKEASQPPADAPPPPGMTGSPPKGFNPMREEDPAWVAKHALPPSPEGENYGGQDSPWPISWSDERTDDEKLFNNLPNGAWFIDPDGVKRKKLRDIPVEGN